MTLTVTLTVALNVTQVRLSMNENVVSAVWWMHGCDKEFLSQVLARMGRESFAAKESIPSSKLNVRWPPSIPRPVGSRPVGSPV